MKTRPTPTRARGFTMLELVIAIGILAILVGMIFNAARGSLALGNKVVQTQNEEMLHQAFFELMAKRFSSLPGNTQLDLKYEDGSQILSELTLQNAPLGFTWGGEERIAKAVQLSTVRRRDGYLDIVMRYYEQEILENSTGTVDQAGEANSRGDVNPSNFPPEPFAEIVLLHDVSYFEWRVLDGRSSTQWRYDWDVLGRLPLMLELKVAFGADGQEMRHVFWLVPKQNPEVMMRQLGQSQGGAGGQQGGGDTEIEIETP